MYLSEKICDSKILLKNLTDKDLNLNYLNWLNDSEVNSHLEIRFSKSLNLENLKNFIDNCNENDSTLLLGIFLKDTYHHIGNIKLGPINWNHKTSDIGFLIGDKCHWGKGYASRAIKLITNYAFQNLSLSKLTAGLYANNIGSKKALLKVGFKEEGLLLSQWQHNDCRQDGIIMGLVNPKI